MIAIRTVVCPVDFSPATARQVDLAADVCRAFGARLVVHHNVTDVSVGAGVGWMWHAGQLSPNAPSVDDQLRTLLGRVPNDVAVESCITRGAVTEGVLAVTDAAEAELVVLSAHAGKTEDHASVIDYLLENSRRAVLALHDPSEDVGVPRFALAGNEHPVGQSMLVPVNLTGDAHLQMEFACDLARTFSVRLHVLHVPEPRSNRVSHDAERESARPLLEALVPHDVKERVAIHLETGDPMTVIVEMARRLSVSCILMGEHARIPAKRWFSHTSPRAALHEAHCPVWYVPSTRAPISISRFALSSEKSIIWGNV